MSDLGTSKREDGSDPARWLGGNSRRQFLERAGCGFGMLAASALSHSALGPAALGQSAGVGEPLRVGGTAKRIIFLFMQGGVSQVDSFDPKPLLATRDGEMMGFDDSRVIANSGKRNSSQRIMKSPWRFRPYGESGRQVSELFPEVARHVDDLCFIHSMHTEGVAHGPATLFLHCGATNVARPSFGSWVHYGLGTENADLPGFVSISPSLGNGGSRNYGQAFLPAVHQGTPIEANAKGELLLPHLSAAAAVEGMTRAQWERMRGLNRLQLAGHADLASREGAIASMELAYRMQTEASGLFDLSCESEQTLRNYGIGEKETDAYGRKCLLARHLCEAGVRFIQVNYGDNSANPAWDQHSNLPKHADHARAVDRPIAALLEDLKARGLLDETIVWWGGEFGRTPYAQQNGTGRDHNPDGFTVWLAGGGARGGMAYGATDVFGHQAVENKVHMHDLHATLLAMLGLDHEQLTYRYAGRDYRLTDVHGRVVREIFG